MTARDYRDDDQRGVGYCSTCGRRLSTLDVRLFGYCEQHGYVPAGFFAPSDRDPGDETDGPRYVVCEQCGNQWDTISPCALCNATRSASAWRI